MMMIPLDTYDKDKFGLSWDIEVSLLLRETVQTNLLTLSITVFLNIGLGAFKDNLTLRLGSLTISQCPKQP